MKKTKKIHRSFLCRNWSIVHQICFFHIIVTLLIAILMLIGFEAYLNMLMNQLYTITNNIFNKETSNHLCMLSEEENRSTQRIFDRSRHQLKTIKLMYNMINDDFIIGQSYDCLNNNKYNDSYAYLYSFCYQFSNQTNGVNYTKYTDILKLTSWLTESLQIFDLELLTLMTHKGDEQFFTQNRGYNCVGYYPHTRQWYIDHIKYMNSGKEFIISDPYVSWINIVFISQTTNLSKTEFDGVIAQDLDFTRMPKISTNTTRFFIVDEDGDIVISDLYADGVTQLLKVYDQNNTGFNLQQWNQIKESNNIIQSLDNSLYDDKIIVMKTKIISNTYYLIALYDETTYKQAQQKIVDQQKAFQNSSLQLASLLCMAVYLITILLQFLIIKYILSDLKYIEYITNKKISYFTKDHLHLNFNKANSTLIRLYNAYLNMTENFDSGERMKKNDICKQLQELQFPSKSRKLKFHGDLDDIPREQQAEINLQVRYSIFRKKSKNYY